MILPSDVEFLKLVAQFPQSDVLTKREHDQVLSESARKLVAAMRQVAAESPTLLTSTQVLLLALTKVKL